MTSAVIEPQTQGHIAWLEPSGNIRPPFFLAKDEESMLRVNAGRLNPSAVITSKFLRRVRSATHGAPRGNGASS
jgi:hypothetical protein